MLCQELYMFSCICPTARLNAVPYVVREIGAPDPRAECSQLPWQEHARGHRQHPSQACQSRRPSCSPLESLPHCRGTGSPPWRLPLCGMPCVSMLCVTFFQLSWVPSTNGPFFPVRLPSWEEVKLSVGEQTQHEIQSVPFNISTQVWRLKRRTFRKAHCEYTDVDGWPAHLDVEPIENLTQFHCCVFIYLKACLSVARNLLTCSSLSFSKSSVIC